MLQPDYEAARRYALERLEYDLDPRLYYHSLAHTRDDVLPATERLATHEGIDAEGMLLLRTAALYHDIGFTVSRNEHELAGVAIVRSVLPSFAYSTAQIDQIGAMIIATRLPQQPRSLLDCILADADLDVLGREDFLMRNRALQAELRAFGDARSAVEFYTGQLAFLTSHSYWTTAAQTLRGPGKDKNIVRLEAIVAQHRCEE